MDRIKTLSDIIATWVTILGVFAGGIFGLIQYVEKSKGERVKATLDYVDRYNKSPLLEAQTQLNEFWNARAADVFAQQKAGEAQLSAYVDGAIREHRLESNVELLVSFFENLRACTCAELCDQATVNRFFDKHAYDWHGLLYPYLAKQRERLCDPTFGESLGLLAKTRNQKDLATAKIEYCSPTPNTKLLCK